MSMALAMGAGLAIAAAVGPAREWTGSQIFRRDLNGTGMVDRSMVIRQEGGVPGRIAEGNTRAPRVERHVPLREMLRRPDQGGGGNGIAVNPNALRVPRPPRPPPQMQERKPAPTIPIVVVRPPSEPERRMGIPTNMSPVPPLTTQPTGDMVIRSDGPTESATPQRLGVTVAPGQDGWNTVTLTQQGFDAANPQRAAAIDQQMRDNAAVMKGRQYATLYVNVDPRDQDSSRTPRMDVENLKVHDSQLHLFRTAAQTQTMLSGALKALANGDAAPMQKMFYEIGDAEAAAKKKSRVVYSTQRQRGWPAGYRPGMIQQDIDPRLMADEEKDAAAAVMAALEGTARYAELAKRGQVDEGVAYLTRYSTEHSDDGRALVALGLQALGGGELDAGLASLAKACALSAAAWTEEVPLAEWGISQAAVADGLVKLQARKAQLQGKKQALGMAAASYVVGRKDAARKLLDVAVEQGYDRADAAVLRGLWKLGK